MFQANWLRLFDSDTKLCVSNGARTWLSSKLLDPTPVRKHQFTIDALALPQRVDLINLITARPALI